MLAEVRPPKNESVESMDKEEVPFLHFESPFLAEFCVSFLRRSGILEEGAPLADLPKYRNRDTVYLSWSWIP